MLEIALVGKPNSGKSTFLRAATLADVKIANYPFTTIKPNIATGFVIANCPCKELGIVCKHCVEGKRFIPISLIDVAGLVPGAHEGHGLGNQFLDDLRQASALIHILDCSGLTDEKGNPCKSHDPLFDLEFLEQEIDEWFYSILKKAMKKGQEDLITTLSRQVTGLGISERQVKASLESFEKELNENTLREFATVLRKIAKPILVAANKIDLPESKKNFELIKKKIKYVVPCSADAEIALRLADKNGLIRYFPGASDFEILKDVDEKQKNALNVIKNILNEWGSTGVQRCLNKTVFELLDYIVVYPVENENKFSDKKGNILPDAYLMPRGSMPKDLAAAVHTELAERFICAINARTKQRVSNDYELKNNDIIKIVVR